MANQFILKDYMISGPRNLISKLPFGLQGMGLDKDLVI